MLKKGIMLVLIAVTICILVGISDYHQLSADSENDQERKEMDVLLHGYNALNGLEITKNDAFMPGKVLSDDYLRHVSKSPDLNDGGSESYRSSSLNEVGSFYAKQTGVDAFGNIFIVDLGLNAQFDTSSTSKTVNSQKYELYTAWVYKYKYISDLSPKKIKDYLDPEFKEELYAVNSKTKAKDLFDRYGTHLFTGVYYGGRLNVTNYMSTTVSSYDFYTGKSLKGKIDAAKGLAEVGAEFSFQEQYDSNEKKEGVTSSYRCYFYGGNAPSGFMTIDQLFDSSEGVVGEKTYQYDKMFKAIDDKKNLMVVGIPKGAYAIPLWDLVDDNSVRRYLIECYTESCCDKYDEYLNQVSSVRLKNELEEENGDKPYLKGIYIRTPNDYMYYVSASDLAVKGAHNVIYEGDVFYLDIENENNYTINFTEDNVNNCQIIDGNQGIFLAKGRVGGTLEISFGDKEENDLDLWISCTLEKHSFEAGSGSKEYPYIITNKDQFSNIKSYPQSHFTLYNDIDFGGNVISSLGDFEGTLDGNYCKLENFRIGTEENWGIFETNNGTIKNLYINKVGTATNNTDFEKGGIDYRKDARNENYSLYSISAKNAGIICGVNEENGLIENCYLENVFIRDVIKNTQYAESGKHIMSVGAICGTNKGTIKDCMAKNPRILCSFYNLSEKLNGQVYTYAGGACGENDGGEIKNCVIDLSTVGSVLSQNYNWFGKDASSSIRAFSGGLVGICNGYSTINSSYVYVRKNNSTLSYHAIDADYFVRNEDKLAEFNALRCVLGICGKDSTVNGKNNIYICLDDELQKEFIRPRKDGDNISSGNNDAYDYVNGIATEGTDQKVNYICTNSNSFEFLSSYGSSKVKHILQTNRNDLISIELVASQGLLRTKFYEGQKYFPENIHINRYINDSPDEELKVYKISVFDKADRNKNIIDEVLQKDNHSYAVEFSIFDGTKQLSTEKNLVIEENHIVGVEIDNAQAIYWDQRNEYANDWRDKIDINLVYADGERKPYTDVDDSVSRITTLYKADRVSLGDNKIKLEFRIDSKEFECYYILNIDDRDIVSITPNVEESSEDYLSRVFESGERISKDKFKGLKIEIEYSKGENKVIDDISKNDEIEIADSVFKYTGEGESFITLCSKDYNCMSSLPLSIKESNSNDNTDNMDNYDDSSNNDIEDESKDENQDNSEIVEDNNNSNNNNSNNNNGENNSGNNNSSSGDGKEEKQSDTNWGIIILCSVLAVLIILAIIFAAHKGIFKKKSEKTKSIRKIAETRTDVSKNDSVDKSESVLENEDEIETEQDKDNS